MRGIDALSNANNKMGNMGAQGPIRCREKRDTHK